jgi:type IV secretory pathway VirB6-like protein
MLSLLPCPALATSQPLANTTIQTCPEPTDPATGAPHVDPTTGEKLPALAARYVPCLRNIIVNAAYQFFDAVYPMMESVIYAALVLAVAFYGAMLLTQMVPTPKASTETMILILKVASVVAFTGNLYWIYDSSIAILNGLIETVTNFSFNGVGGNSLRCQLSLTVWERIDCVLDRVVGINEQAGREISNGIIGFLWDNAFSGAMGIFVFLAGLYMIANLVMGLFRAIAQYIMSLIILALLVMISLLFIPLILFKNTAMSYFTRWLKQLISIILQPVIVFAFMSVLLTAVDVTLFSGPNSFYRTVAGDRSADKNFSLSRYMEENNLYVRRQAGTHTQSNQPPAQAPTAYGSVRNASNTPTLPTSGPASRPAANNSLTEFLVGVEYKTIDWNRLQSIRSGGPALGSGPPEQAMRQAVGNSLLMSIVTVFLLLQIMTHVPRLAQDLTGGVKETIDTGGLAGNALSMGRGVSSTAGNITQRLGDLVTRRAGGAT